VRERPDLASRYAVRHTPLVLAVDAASGAVVATHRGDPDPETVRDVLRLVGRDRPVSRNEMCRGVEPTCPARANWLSPR